MIISESGKAGAGIRAGAGSRRTAVSCPRLTAVLIALTAWALLPAGALAAGGPFVVDDAEIGDPGSCKVETRASLADNRDAVIVASPGCVVNLGRPVEVAGEFAHARSGGEWGSSFTVKAKTNLVPIGPGRFGLGLVAGTSVDLTGRRFDGVFVMVPVSFQLHESLRLNVNGGWLHDPVADSHAATWGVGLSWQVARRLSVIGEVFGAAGADVDHRPGMQAGLRLTPQENFDIDLVYGRNLGGEQANWITVGLTLRFEPKQN